MLEGTFSRNLTNTGKLYRRFRVELVAGVPEPYLHFMQQGNVLIMKDWLVSRPAPFFNSIKDQTLKRGIFYEMILLSKTHLAFSTFNTLVRQQFLNPLFTPVIKKILDLSILKNYLNPLSITTWIHSYPQGLQLFNDLCPGERMTCGVSKRRGLYYSASISYFVILLQ